MEPQGGEPQANFRASQDDFRWKDVAYQPYKQDGSAPFKDISRQTLFHEDSLACELRYFEMAAGGYSTLERHEHAHAVMILRGHGTCLVGQEVHAVKPLDMITIPAHAWHQFRATDHEPFGFLCMVNSLRDRPKLPTEEELATLTALPEVARFLEQPRRPSRQSALAV